MAVCRIGIGEQVVAQLGPMKGLGVVAAAAVAAAAVSPLLVVSVEIHCTRVTMFRSLVAPVVSVDVAAAAAAAMDAPTLPGLRPTGERHG